GLDSLGDDPLDRVPDLLELGGFAVAPEEESIDVVVAHASCASFASLVWWCELLRGNSLFRFPLAMPEGTNGSECCFSTESSRSSSVVSWSSVVIFFGLGS